MEIPGTTAYRLINGVGSGRPGHYVDRLGPILFIQSEHGPDPSLFSTLSRRYPDSSFYFKQLTPHIRRISRETASPIHISGPQIVGRFPILENGLTFLLSMESGYSTGLFLDQRDNRRRILEMNLHGKVVLNTFAYTCAFSVCAAKAGASVTSIDLSKNYLDWGRENFRANQLDDTAHDFIFGDVFDWLPRLAKKGRKWDIIILDPPTFSTAPSSGIFQARKDYPKLLQMAKASLRPGGAILACLNTLDVSGAEFKKVTGVRHILPLPPDFPVPAGTELHLKSGWV